MAKRCRFRHVEAVVNPPKSRRKVVVRVQLLCWRSLHNWVVYLMILIRESLFSGQMDNRQILHGHKAPHKILERKGPSLRRHSEVWASWAQPVCSRFEERTQEETLHQERCARRAAWDLAKNIYKLKNTDKTTFYSLIEPKATLALTAKLLGGTRIRGWFWSFNAHAEQKRIWVQPKWILFGYPGLRRWWQPAGSCKHTRKHKCTFTILISSWRYNYWTTRLQFYHLESSAEKTDIPMSGQSGSKPRLTNNGREFFCKTKNFVPLVVPGLSSSSGTRSSSTSPPQDSSSASSNPELQRSDEQAPGDWRDSTKSQNKNKKESNNQATGDRLRDLPGWLEEFTDNLEDTGTPVLADVPQDSESERPTKVVSKFWKHSIRYSLPKRPKLRSMLANQDDKGSLQKTHWWCSTSSNWVRWLDNSRSHSPQRGRWISE